MSSPPTNIEKQEIAAFCSYAREDELFVEQLRTAVYADDVVLQGDWELERGDSYREQLRLMILGCEVFIAVLSPDSVESPACREEVDIAAELGKRLIPILIRDHGDDRLVHPALREPQWTFMRSPGELETSLKLLSQALRTDYELSREHRRLLQLAENWERRNRSSAYLLRGEALKSAEVWIARAGVNPRGFPKPTGQQSELILRSQRYRTRLMVALVSAVAVIAIALGVFGVFAIVQRNTARANAAEAEKQRTIAIANQKEAERQQGFATQRQKEAEQEARIATSRQLAAQSDQLRGGAARHFMQSFLLAIEAYKRFPARESDSVLRASLALAPLPGPRLGQKGSVAAVAFSPDAKYVFTGSRDKTARVFDRASGRELARLTHTWGVNALAINADGKFVTSGSGDEAGSRGDGSRREASAGEVRVWEWRTGKELVRLPFEKPVSMVTFVGSQDMVAGFDSSGLKTATFDRQPGGFTARTAITTGQGSWISSFSKDGTLAAVRRPKSAEIVSLIDATSGQVPIDDSETKIILSPDNKRLAVSGDYGDTRVLDWPSGKVTSTTGASTGVTFSPDGTLLAQIDRDSNTRVTSSEVGGDPVGAIGRTDQLAGTITDLAEFLPNAASLARILQGPASLAILPQDAALATAMNDGAVRIWRPRPKFEGVASSFNELFRMGEDKITSMSVSRDGRFVVTGDEAGVRVWELAKGNEVKHWLNASRFKFGRRYAATGTDHSIQMIDIQRDASVAKIIGNFSEFVFSPDQSLLLVVTPDSLEFRRVPTLDLVRRVPTESEIDQLKFDTSGRSILAALKDGTITEIGMNGQHVERIRKGGASDPEISPKGNYFILSGAAPHDGSIPAWFFQLYERGGRQIASVKTQAFDSHVLFAPSEAFFVAHVNEMTLGVWRSATGEPMLRIPISDHFGSFIISPDSRYIAVEAGPRIALWDVAERRMIRSFDHFSRVGHMAFSPDLRWFLADCNSLLVWSMDTGELSSAVDGIDYDDRSSFTPDEKYIVSQMDLTLGGATPYLRFTLFRPEDLIAESCRRATRNLTDAEWQQYLPSEPKAKTCPHLP